VNRKIIFSLSILPLLIGALSGCSKTDDEIKGRQKPYRITTQEGYKTTITASNGAPVNITSTLFRSDLFQLCDKITPADMEDYFALAKETNFNCIDLPFMWRELEQTEGVYDFSHIETYLNLAKKYNLKINLVWYGSFVDGETHTINMPEYIYQNHQTYPMIQYCLANSIFGDTVIMDYSNKTLLKVEGNAVKALFNFVAEWNLKNEKYNPIMIFQCGQGLDRLERYRIEQYSVKYEGEIMSNDQAEKFVEDYVVAISKAAKNSLYAPITRVDFCEQTAITQYVRSVENIPTLDILSTTYLATVANTKTGINNFANEYGSTKPIMASENWANDLNYRSALVTYARGGCGFTTYNLSSPLYYPLQPITTENQINGGVLYYRRDASGATLSDRFKEVNKRSTNMKQVNDFVNKAYVPVSKAVKENFALFGFDSKVIREEGVQKVYFENGIMLENVTTDTTSYGLSMFSDNYLFLISTAAGELTIDNCSIQSCSTGLFNEDGFWDKDESILIEGNSLLYEKNKLYRIRINSIQSLPSEEELDDMNYKNTNDIVRG